MKDRRFIWLQTAAIPSRPIGGLRSTDWDAFHVIGDWIRAAGGRPRRHANLLARALHRASITADALRDRALNEAPAYALRIDVAEKLARLSAHLDAITRLLDAGGELGKRLDFLIQQLHREANTLGSKSPALEQTNITVEMKVAVEPMREPV